MASSDGLRKFPRGSREFASCIYPAENVVDSQEASMPCLKKACICCRKAAVVRTKLSVLL